MPSGPIPAGRLSHAARFVRMASARRVVGGGDRGIGRLLIPLLVIAVIAFAAVKARSAQTDARRTVAVASVAEDLSSQAGRLQLLELSHRPADERLVAALSRGRGAVGAAVRKLRREPRAQQATAPLLDAAVAYDSALASFAATNPRQSGAPRRVLRRTLAHLSRSAATAREELSTRPMPRTPTRRGCRCGRSGSGSGWRPC